MARGPRVPLIAAASAWVCVLAEDPPGDAPPAVVREEVVAVEVLFERVAGLDIGKNSLTVCRRTPGAGGRRVSETDRKSTRLNSSHANISYAVFCLKKKKNRTNHKH